MEQKTIIRKINQNTGQICDVCEYVSHFCGLEHLVCFFIDKISRSKIGEYDNVKMREKALVNITIGKSGKTAFFSRLGFDYTAMTYDMEGKIQPIDSGQFGTKFMYGKPSLKA